MPSTLYNRVSEQQRNNNPPARQGPLLKPANITGDIARFILLFQGDQGFQRPNGQVLRTAPEPSGCQGSSRGQAGVKPGSSRGQAGVKLGSSRGQVCVKARGQGWVKSGLKHCVVPVLWRIFFIRSGPQISMGGYTGTQRDTAGYSGIQRDTAGYSGIQRNMRIQRDTAGYHKNIL